MVAAAGPLEAAKRPRYGGTLRVELRAVAASFDPREWPAGSEEAANGEKLAALVYDRLIALDNYGRFQPQLAVEWSHDATFQRWQFTLRRGVKFSDGSPLTTADAVTALQPLLSGGRLVSESDNSVVVQSAAPMPDLLEELASGRYFIYRAQAGGALTGTGAFVLAEQPAANSPGAPASQRDGENTRLFFRANPAAWSGRPFVDAVEVTLGVPSLRQLYDLQLGRADVVELSPDLVHRAAQAGLRTWSSAPILLYALRFEDAQPAAQDARLREAISLSLDQATMAGVLLQKQAEPAAALLPQWLSGYAFLFAVETNPDRAKEIRYSLPPTIAGSAEPLRLRVNAAGDLAKLLGDRVAVNARQSLLIVQVMSRTSARAAAAGATPPKEPAPGISLVSWRFSTLSPRTELDALANGLGLGEAPEGSVSSADPGQLYARERRILEDRRVVPLVVVPEFAGIGPSVRNWMPARWGEWHLADVWLDGMESPSPAKPAGAQP